MACGHVWRIVLINGSWETHSECNWVHSLGWGLNCVRVERAGSLSSFFLCSCLWTGVFKFLLWLLQSAGLRGADKALGDCVLTIDTDKDQCLRPMGTAKPFLGWGSESWQRFFFSPFGLWRLWTVYACMSACVNNWNRQLQPTTSHRDQTTSPRAVYNKHECACILAVVGCLLVDVTPSENACPT